MSAIMALVLVFLDAVTTPEGFIEEVGYPHDPPFTDHWKNPHRTVTNPENVLVVVVELIRLLAKVQLEMGDKEWAADNVFELFGDGLARHILLLLNRQPMAVDDLANRFDVSKPTIYRRINALSEYGLIAERQEIDESGHHYKTFETVLNEFRVEMSGEKYKIELTKQQDIFGQFEAFWSDLEDETPPASTKWTTSLETNDVDENLPHG